MTLKVNFEINWPLAKEKSKWQKSDALGFNGFDLEWIVFNIVKLKEIKFLWAFSIYLLIRTSNPVNQVKAVEI